MPSANQYLRYITQTEGRIEKITATIAALKSSKTNAPKENAQKIAAKIKLQQEELKSSIAKLKEHKTNLKEANKPVDKKVTTPKTKVSSTKGTVKKSVKPKTVTKKTTKKPESESEGSDHVLSPMETQLLNAVTSLATRVKSLEDRLDSLNSTPEKVS